MSSAELPVTSDIESRFTKRFGAYLPRLPWVSPEDAFLYLPDTEKQRVVALKNELHASFSTPEPWKAVLKSIEKVFPGDRIILHSGAENEAPSWMIHSLHGEHQNSLIDGAEQCGRLRLYKLDESDPFNNRPVNLTTLALGCDQTKPSALKEEHLRFLARYKICHLLRTLTYRHGHLDMYLGLCRDKKLPQYQLVEHAVLWTVQGVIQRWVHLARALGTNPYGTDALFKMLDNHSQYAFILHENHLLFANQVARHHNFPCPTNIPPEGTRSNVTTLRLPFEDSQITLLLVDGHSSSSRLPIRDRLSALPEYLHPVAAHLRKGAPDKEIASSLNLSIATARTYVSRVLKFLEIHNRRDLIHHTPTYSRRKHEKG